MQVAKVRGKNHIDAKSLNLHGDFLTGSGTSSMYLRDGSGSNRLGVPCDEQCLQWRLQLTLYLAAHLGRLHWRHCFEQSRQLIRHCLRKKVITNREVLTQFEIHS